MKVTAEQIIEHMKQVHFNHIIQTPGMLKQTVGGLNGMDMETYNKGYTDALEQLIDYFGDRV
ncbi:hypothetical protein [Paenibacillus tianjinensis]|uniref:Uncharacterized protein n=1 Tax=Paenibacillus tianjinensis TaxID=2810347 RepID=A0ABX7L5P5_9BACL|nr:hypothetical protein [Paenibacillus tianjinensis]QSF43422.1 hypothetical protein JRJ22_19350 [Paenibacillus tianjinensis]